MKVVLLKTGLIALCCLLLMYSQAQVASVTFTVHVPSIGNEAKAVYLAGSFNYWHEADSLYRMQQKAEGIYTLTIPAFKGVKYQYKYCLGSWNEVELAENESNIPNRHFTASRKQQVTDTVARWKQQKAAADSSERMKKFVAMKDSLMLKLKPELAALMDMVKLYAQNMLSENPDPAEHARLNAATIAKFGSVYSQVTGLLWNICVDLGAEKRKAILKKLSNSNNNDPLNTFLNAVSEQAK